MEPGHERGRILADEMLLFRSGNPTAYLHAVSVISGEKVCEKTCEKTIRFPPGGNSNDVWNCDFQRCHLQGRILEYRTSPRHIETDSAVNNGIMCWKYTWNNVGTLHISREVI